jgi:hypothetical protein
MLQAATHLEQLSLLGFEAQYNDFNKISEGLAPQAIHNPRPLESLELRSSDLTTHHDFSNLAGLFGRLSGTLRSVLLEDVLLDQVGSWVFLLDHLRNDVPHLEYARVSRMRLLRSDAAEEPGQIT